MKVDLSLENLRSDFLNETKLKNNYIEDTGFFRPADCLPQHKVAIIIPYRDREQHLHILLKHLHGVLQRQQLLYKIFVIEQVSPLKVFIFLFNMMRCKCRSYFFLFLNLLTIEIVFFSKSKK